MPKGGKKGFKKSGNASFAGSDIRLADFADSHVSAGRTKKPVNSLVREVKSLCSLEREWLEGEIVDSDSDATDSPDLSGRKKSKNKTRRQATCDDDNGKDYPLDLWFILSEYIKPEDVKVFALLCKSSYLVSQTYTFWIRLYRRYYRTGEQLPRRLQPHCIERPYCLKACVVRALYHFYPQFSTKISRPSSGEIYNLVKFVCVSMWRLQKNDKWLFYFKFRSQLTNPAPSNRKENSHEARLWTVWDANDYSDPQILINDVNANPEEGCKILQVTCPNFIAAPVVMGGHLADVRVTCSRDMIKQKLTLTFSFSSYRQTRKNAPAMVGSRDCGGTGEILEFEPVENMVILDWWHPQYPLAIK